MKKIVDEPTSEVFEFNTKELAQEILKWLYRDIPNTVVGALKIILARYIDTGIYKDEMEQLIGEQPIPVLSVQRFVDEAYERCAQISDEHGQFHISDEIRTLKKKHGKD